MGERVGFTSDELELDYHAWHALVLRSALDAPTREWLSAWERWDFACSPMDDTKRGQIRRGHYLGWFAARREGVIEGLELALAVSFMDTDSARRVRAEIERLKASAPS